MINVLLLGMTPNPGGLETYMINIFSRLEGHGFHFEFLNIQKDNIAYSKFIRNHNGTIRQVLIKGTKFEHLTRRHKANIFFKHHHDYNIVHLNTTYLNQIYWIKAAKRYGIKHLIIQSHNCGVTYNSKIFKLISTSLDRYNKLYLKCHLNIHKLAASINCGKWMFGNNAKFKVINNGINTANYIYNPKYRTVLKQKIGIPANDKVVITTARLERQKNYPKIINVFNAIYKQDNSVDLVIVGTGSKLPLIRSMIHKFQLDNNVYLLGQQSKNTVAKLLNIADLMLMPSLYEAVPFSLTEAQANGVPAVVSKHSIPYSANISGEVRYLSLNESNKDWAQVSLKILNESPFSIQKKNLMNTKVERSPYSLTYSTNQIKQYYLRLLEK